MYQVAKMMYSSGRCQFLVEDLEKDIGLTLLTVCLPVKVHNFRVIFKNIRLILDSF